MDHEAADGEVVEEPVGHPLLRPSRAVWDASAGDVGLGEEREARRGQDHAPAQARRRHRHPRPLRRLGDHPDVDLLPFEHLGETTGRRLLCPERDHRHPLFGQP